MKNMKDQLYSVWKSLNPEHQNKDILNIELTAEYNNILTTDKLTVIQTGKTIDVLLAGLGKMERYYRQVDLFYKAKRNRLILKPKLLKEYLVQLNNDSLVQSTSTYEPLVQSIFKDWL